MLAKRYQTIKLSANIPNQGAFMHSMVAAVNAPQLSKKNVG